MAFRSQIGSVSNIYFCPRRTGKQLPCLVRHREWRWLGLLLLPGVWMWHWRVVAETAKGYM